MIKPRSKTVNVIVALYKGRDVLAWLGGDGPRIPVFEAGASGKLAAGFFVQHNKIHKPVLYTAEMKLLKPIKIKLAKKAR